MEKTQQCTAILIFARSSGTESKAKQFAAVNRRKNRKIAEEVLDHSLQQANVTNLAVFHLSETEQKGNTSGERLIYVFRSSHVLVFVKNTLSCIYTHRGPPSYTTPIVYPYI